MRYIPRALLPAVAFCCLVVAGVTGSYALAGQSTPADAGTEFVQDGGFELGIVNVDIRRFPRYSKAQADRSRVPVRASVNAISGNHSLQLPGLTKGGYTLVYPTYLLLDGQQYRFRASLRCAAAVSVGVIAFTGSWLQSLSYSERLQAGLQNLDLSFTVDGNRKVPSAEVPHFMRLSISSAGDCLLDNVSFTGKRGSQTLTPVTAWLTPDQPMAVYPIGAVGAFTLSTVPGQDKLDCEISDPVQKATVAKIPIDLEPGRSGGGSAVIPLRTLRRGFYRVSCGIDRSDGQFDELVRRAYVVIDPEPGTVTGRHFFAACAEEHGTRTDIDAAIWPDELYGLARAVGIDSVRVFSLASPELLSRDGVDYDFTELDAAIATLDRHQLDRFLVLGSNDTSRTPAWLRKPTTSETTVDLLSGLRVPSERARFAKRGGDRYLDLDSYRGYLQRLMQHVGKRVPYYEVWNEPGHKFSAADIVRLTSATHAVQGKVAPETKLLGFSSTVRADWGKGRDRNHLPSLLDEVARLGGLAQVDGISFHGRHAFGYLARGYDERNLDTGFTARLRTIMRREGRADLPLWDTEFGISWRSPHPERMDALAGAAQGQLEYPRTIAPDVLDVARQLPAVYAQAAADGVATLAWFSLDSSIADIAHPERRWVFFDAMLEPMPHLAVFDAMTGILGAAKYNRTAERKDGTRSYLFSRDRDTVVLMYNWQEKPVDVSIQMGNTAPLVLDVMGNPAEFQRSGESAISVSVDGWPKYIVIPGTAPADIVIR